MKAKITLLFAVLFLSFNSSFAQNEEDMNLLSIFSEYAKAKNYEAAYGPWMELRQKNPKFNRAIYTYGEKILDHKIENTSGPEQIVFIKDLVKLWDERSVHFASKTPKGAYMAKACQLQYDYKKELNMSDLQLYNCFDDAYKTDATSFTNPKALYTYFKLAVKLYDSGAKPAEELFTKYDEISEKVEAEIKNYTVKLNKFVSADGEPDLVLSKKDQNKVKSYSSYLKAYDQIANGMDSDLGIRANCSNLIPLYSKNFESNKNDGLWLQRAMNRLYTKECTDDPLFIKIVQQKNNIEPNASTAYYLGILKAKEGNNNEALKYYNQAVELETDSYEKAKILYRIASSFKKKGSYGTARNYYRKALKANPSMGRCHLAIASMYASSANNCGDSVFNKRAVYWLASQEAAKAGRVDPNLRKSASRSVESYNAKAPTKAMIFTEGNSGQTITFKCWIGGSVKVPNL
ncbi:MAG: tetratricopeptide repeat protein [Flavobacteriaceae bacterium]|nr:tetratricopeptide repeat protein [Bacteroidia bacterium]NNK82187.1 tetratricopeptide repeat protein [Flavobacteriaceae bacterium]